MNILFLVNSFKRGGAERVILNLLNYLPKLNSDLNLFLYFLERADDPYPVRDLLDRQGSPRAQGLEGGNSRGLRFPL